LQAAGVSQTSRDADPANHLKVTSLAEVTTMIEIKHKDRAVYQISYSAFRNCWLVLCLATKKVIRCNSVSEAFAVCAKAI
jgi:hypothetical protein